MRTVLSIAGSDSGGGAGIQADIKTITMNGAYAMTAVTALTAQNTLGVKGIFDINTDFVREQLDAVFEDIFPDAVKIGMVSSEKTVYTIAERLKHYGAKNIVVDPVMVATSGAALIKSSAVKALCNELFAAARVVTPNIPEAEVLAEMKISCGRDMEKAAEYIGNKYGCGVLVKGGHSVNDANDVLYENGEIGWLCKCRINNSNTHGTGCTLSSAIAVNLAKGCSVYEAAWKAKEYICGALAAELNLGSGKGPLMHNFSLK